MFVAVIVGARVRLQIAALFLPSMLMINFALAGCAPPVIFSSACLRSACRLPEYIFVVDPRGNLVLSYCRDAEPRKLIKDLARLF